eukprot:2955145-Amphidinium_carterae.1
MKRLPVIILGETVFPKYFKSVCNRFDLNGSSTVAKFPALAFPSSSKATRSAPPDSAASSSGATAG